MTNEKRYGSRGIHEMFELAYSDLPEECTLPIIQTMMSVSEVSESEDQYSKLAEFVSALVKSDISEECLDETLDEAFGALEDSAVEGITESFMFMSVQNILEATEEQRSQAASNVLSKRADAFQKAKAEGRDASLERKRFKQAVSAVDPSPLDKLKRAAKKVWGSVKRGTSKAVTATGNALNKAADNTSRALNKAAIKTSVAVRNAPGKIAKAAEKAGKKIKDKYEEVKPVKVKDRPVGLLGVKQANDQIDAYRQKIKAHTNTINDLKKYDNPTARATIKRYEKFIKKYQRGLAEYGLKESLSEEQLGLLEQVIIESIKEQICLDLIGE